MNINFEMGCPCCHTTDVSYKYGTSTVMYCSGEDCNRHTEYYDCNVCHSQFHIVRRGNKLESIIIDYKAPTKDINTVDLSTEELRSKYRQEWLEEQLEDLTNKLATERLKYGRLT